MPLQPQGPLNDVAYGAATAVGVADVAGDGEDLRAGVFRAGREADEPHDVVIRYVVPHIKDVLVRDLVVVEVHELPVGFHFVADTVVNIHYPQTLKALYDALTFSAGNNSHLISHVDGPLDRVAVAYVHLAQQLAVLQHQKVGIGEDAVNVEDEGVDGFEAF